MAPRHTQATVTRVLKQGETSIGRLATRLDGWVNTLTGLGTTRDKRTSTSFLPDAPLDISILSALYHNDDLANRIVSAVPDEALRQGFCVQRASYQAESEDDSVGDVQEKSIELERKLRSLDLTAKAREAMTWGRLYGGGALLIGAVGGGLPQDPLAEESVTDIEFLTVLERSDLTPYQFYSDPMSPNYGKVSHYWVNPTGVRTAPASTVIVHESRLIIFGGVLTSRRERDRNQGWDHSVLQRCVNVLTGVNGGFDSVLASMNDMSQAVFKLQGLIDMISEGDSAELSARMSLMDTLRSSIRAIVLDAESESFEMVERGSMAGVSELIDRLYLRLASAARMPYTILMGQSPAGLSATGASDLRWWYDTIRTSQEHELKPRLERVLKLLTHEDGWEVVFPSLWQMTPIEEAALRASVADTDVKYVGAGVLLPEEITLARWGAGKYSPETTVDVSARKIMLATELKEMTDPTPKAPALPFNPGNQTLKSNEEEAPAPNEEEPEVV